MKNHRYVWEKTINKLENAKIIIYSDGNHRYVG